MFEEYDDKISPILKKISNFKIHFHKVNNNSWSISTQFYVTNQLRPNSVENFNLNEISKSRCFKLFFSFFFQKLNNFNFFKKWRTMKKWLREPCKLGIRNRMRMG